MWNDKCNDKCSKSSPGNTAAVFCPASALLADPAPDSRLRSVNMEQGKRAGKPTLDDRAVAY